MGAIFMQQLEDCYRNRHPRITEVRGRGLILGVELTIDGAEIVKKCMEKGLLIITSGGGNVLRFVPPLIVTEQDVDQAVGYSGGGLGGDMKKDLLSDYDLEPADFRVIFEKAPG